MVGLKHVCLSFSLLCVGGSLGIGGGRGGGEKVVDWCLFEFNVGSQVLRVFQMLVGVPDIFFGGGVLCVTTFFQVVDSWGVASDSAEIGLSG